MRGTPWLAALACLMALASCVCAYMMGEGVQATCTSEAQYDMGHDFEVEAAYCDQEWLVFDRFAFRLTPNAGFVESTIQSYKASEFNFTNTPSQNMYINYNIYTATPNAIYSILRDGVKVEETLSDSGGIINWVNTSMTFSAPTNWSFIETTQHLISATAYIDADNQDTNKEVLEDPKNWDRTAVGAQADATPKRFFSGQIDEVRVSTVVRSKEWTKTEYNNQARPDTFYRVEKEEEMP